MKLGDKIRTIRKMKGLSQENVAAMVGISNTAFAKIEREETNPSQNRVQQIAEAFKMSKAELENFGENGVFYLNESNNNNSQSIFIANSSNTPELANEVIRLRTANEGLSNEILHLKKIIELLEGRA